MLVNFICGFMLVLLAYILSVIPSTKDAGEALKYIFRLVPSYCLGEGILNLANRQLSSLLFHVSATDAVTLGGTALFLTAIALLASFIPSRSSARIDPAHTLRSDL